MPLLLTFFKFDVHDWITSDKIASMNVQQIGAYIMLLAHCWSQARCSLPNDPLVLRRLSRWQDDRDGDLGPVLACFTPLKRTGRLTNRRLYREWQQARAKIKLFRTSGQRGAQKRWPNGSQAQIPMKEAGTMPAEVKALLSKIGKPMA
jgi:uncharacterized protein YdaU (DUF1376 family)